MKQKSLSPCMMTMKMVTEWHINYKIKNTNLVSPSPDNLLSRNRRYVTSKTKNILTYLHLLQGVPHKMGFNPTLHGIKNVAGDTGGGHYGHPLENDTRGHFCGQIDL